MTGNHGFQSPCFAALVSARTASTFARDACHSETFFQQPGHRGKTVVGLQRLSAVAFEEDDAKGGLFFQSHSLEFKASSSTLWRGGAVFRLAICNFWRRVSRGRLARGQIRFELRLEQR